MKKVLFLFLFLSGSVTFLSAQKRFYLDITNDSIPNLAKVTDTVNIGDKVYFMLTFKNDGVVNYNRTKYTPETLPKDVYSFNFNVVAGANANENHVAFVHDLTLDSLGYLSTETLMDSFNVTDVFFTPGSTNIVITWPSGGRAIEGDSLDTLPSKSYKFYVNAESKTASISNIPQNTFKIYPNPAKDMVNIQMKEAGTGMIRLMDMTGKLITAMPYAAKAGENISLPLNEGAAIPDGLYLISIENGNSSTVSKIMICR